MKYIRTGEGLFEVEPKYRDLIGAKGMDYYRGWKIKRQADTIEELIQDDDLALWFELTVDCDDSYYEFTLENVLMSIRDAKKIAYEGYYGHFNIKDIKELYIKNKEGNYIKVAEKESPEKEFKLL